MQGSSATRIARTADVRWHATAPTLRKFLHGTGIARWYCPHSHTTFSLLPNCLAARLPALAVNAHERKTAVASPDLQIPCHQIRRFRDGVGAHGASRAGSARSLGWRYWLPPAKMRHDARVVVGPDPNAGRKIQVESSSHGVRVRRSVPSSRARTTTSDDLDGSGGWNILKRAVALNACNEPGTFGQLREHRAPDPGAYSRCAPRGCPVER